MAFDVANIKDQNSFQNASDPKEHFNLGWHIIQNQ